MTSTYEGRPAADGTAHPNIIPEETAVNETALNICWHDDETSQGHCRHDDIDDRDLITWGRCRSGRRWFWAASVFLTDVSAHDWADTEEEAIEAARDVVVGLAADRPAIAIRGHGHASHVLKGINAAKRAQRPAKGDGDTAPREFLYGLADVRDGYTDSVVGQRIVRFQITKRTAKRIYYVRGETWNKDRTAQVPDIGYVNRQELEEKGEVRNRGVHWCRPDSRLYAAPPELEQRRQEQPDLGELKAAMADAHPDRGGTNEAFRAARKAYVTVRDRVKSTR